MPDGIGNFVFKLLTAIPIVHSFINKRAISSFADDGPLPGLYTTKCRGKTPLWEMLHKEYFALEVPTPSDTDIKSLPNIKDVIALFKRTGDFKESRVSLLLPFFAQHLTDAVFQSDNKFETSATHEIILNQIYGNTPQDEKALRLGQDGKLMTQTKIVNDRSAEFPDALLEEKGGEWSVKERYAGLSYLQKPGKTEELLEKYGDHKADICATGLFQGNLTLGNFAITALLVREHNRLCDGILAERKRKGLSTSDDEVFRVAQQNNITAYLKVVIEDYINAFAGQKVFILDTKSFFHEGKRWCRETPLPFHFNILYRIHSMIPDTLNGYEKLGFSAMIANNSLVMQAGIGEIFQLASRQGAGQARLGNTHSDLLGADGKGVAKAREVLGFFNSHKEVQEKGSSVGFDAFDPKFRAQLSKLYNGNPDRVEFAVGILAELPKLTWKEKLGFKDEPIIGPTLMNAIAKHAFRHILSNRFMTREYLNAEVMSDFGWENLGNTSSVADLVKRNVSGEMDQAQADKLKIGFANPNY